MNKKDKTTNNKIKKNDEGFLRKANNVLFNSVGTAFVALMLMAGASVYGVMSVIGDDPVCVALSVIVVILLVSKVLNKLGRK